MTNAKLPAILLILWVASLAGPVLAQDDAETSPDGDVATEEAADGVDSETGETEAEEAAEAAEEAPAEPVPEEGVPAEEPPAAETPAEEAPAESTGAAGGLAAPTAAAVEEVAEDAAESDDVDEVEEVEEEEAPAAAPEPSPWRSSFFIFNQGATFNSFARNSQLSYNPSYTHTYTVIPRWYIEARTFIWVLQSISLELTDTDFLVNNREPLLSDTITELRHIEVWEGFVFQLRGRLTLPASKISQAANRYFELGAALTVVRPVPDAKLTLIGVAQYRYWFAGSNTSTTGRDLRQQCQQSAGVLGGQGIEAATGAVSACDATGISTAQQTILYGLIAIWQPLPGFNVSGQALGFHQVLTPLAPFEVNGVSIPGVGTRWRDFTLLSLSVNYDFTQWLNVALGIQNSGTIAPLFNPSGTLRGPFNPDTQVFMTATFGIDGLWEELTGGSDEELSPEELQRRRQGLASGPAQGATF